MKTKDFLGIEWEYDCMGCAVSRGNMKVPGGMIKRTQYFCVHQDPLIPLPGFLVIASTRHIHSISEMQEFEYDEFSKLLRTTRTVIRKVVRDEDLTLVQEESSSHFHLWFFPWTKSVLDQYGPPSLSKIRGIMADYRQKPIEPKQWRDLQNLIDQIKNSWPLET